MPSKLKTIITNILYNTVRIGVTDTKFHKKVKNKSIHKRIKLIPLKKMASERYSKIYLSFNHRK